MPIHAFVRISCSIATTGFCISFLVHLSFWLHALFVGSVFFAWVANLTSLPASSYDSSCMGRMGCSWQGPSTAFPLGLMPREHPYRIVTAELLSSDFGDLGFFRKKDLSAHPQLNCFVIPFVPHPQHIGSQHVGGSASCKCQSDQPSGWHSPLSTQPGSLHLGQFAFLLGCKVGEALNPGPCDESRARSSSFAIVNPTCIANKGKTLLDLSHRHKIETFIVSETAATVKAQCQLTQVLRPHGFRAIWSAPMASQFQTITGFDSHERQGRWSGVLVVPAHSSMP